MKICLYNVGHMTRLFPRPYMVINLKIFFFGTNGPIYMNFGMLHRGPWPIIFCSNYDPGITLTYFTARSNFAN